MTMKLQNQVVEYAVNKISTRKLVWTDNLMLTLSENGRHTKYKESQSWVYKRLHLDKGENAGIQKGQLRYVRMLARVVLIDLQCLGGPKAQESIINSYCTRAGDLNRI